MPSSIPIVTSLVNNKDISDLEEFKKSFSTSIAKTVDSKLALVDETLTSLNAKSGVGGLPVEEIRKIISDSIKARDEKHALTEEKIKDLVTKTLALQKLEVIQKSSLTEDKVLDLINKSVAKYFQTVNLLKIDEQKSKDIKLDSTKIKLKIPLQQ